MSFLDDLADKEKQVNELITQQTKSTDLTEPPEETTVPQSQVSQQQSPQQIAQQQPENPDLQYLRGRISTIEQENNTLRQALQKMQNDIANKNKEPEKPTFEVPSDIAHVELSEDESTAIGDPKVVAKIVTQQIDAKLKPIINQLNAVTKAINEQLGSVNQTMQQNTRNQFEEKILTAVPNARELLADGSPFIQWLHTTTIYGTPVMQNFSFAWNSQDAVGIINIMKSYLEAKQKKQQPTDKNLESQVEPSLQSKSTPTEDNKVFYFEDYQNAVSKLAKKQISQKEFDKIEQAYNSASNLGKVSFQKRGAAR